MHTGSISTDSPTQRAEKIKRVARDFESLFSSMMLKAMRKTVGDNPLIPSSFGEKVYTEMLDDELSKIFSSRGSFGLADIVEREITRLENPEIAFKNLKNIGTKDFWSIQNRYPGLSPSNISAASAGVEQWDGLISDAAQKFGIDKNLIKAVISQESAGNPYAVSRAGAKGLMQLMDATAGDLGVKRPFSPEENIDGGVRYLKSMLEKFGGDEKLALASYNAGPHAVEKYKGIPPYKETIDYVNSVLRLKELYSNKE